MEVVLYATAAQKRGNKLEKLIQDELPQIQIEKINSIRSLKGKLCRPLNRISVIVMFVISEDDIDHLLTLRPLFDGIRLILVLPERKKKLTALGLVLNPCFVGYSDSDLIDIASVLKKIDQRIKDNMIK